MTGRMKGTWSSFLIAFVWKQDTILRGFHVQEDPCGVDYTKMPGGVFKGGKVRVIGAQELSCSIEPLSNS